MEKSLDKKFCEFVAQNKPFLRSLHEESKEENVQKGVLICQDDGEFYFGGVCTGREKCLAVKDCGEGEAVGRFHTHPGGYMIPSFGDVAGGLYDLEVKRGCVSGVNPSRGREEIACWRYKESPEARAWWREWSEVTEGTEKYKELLEEATRPAPPESVEALCRFDIE